MKDIKVVCDEIITVCNQVKELDERFGTKYMDLRKTLKDCLNGIEPELFGTKCEKESETFDDKFKVIEQFEKRMLDKGGYISKMLDFLFIELPVCRRREIDCIINQLKYDTINTIDKLKAFLK